MNFFCTKYRLSFFMLLSFLIILFSCKKDVILNDWENTPVVYALLNLKDSVHYIRINRAFIADVPNQMVNNPDSISYGVDELRVTIQSMQGATPVGEVIEFQPTSRFQKVEGLFTSRDYFVYRSDVQLEGDTEYYLEITNMKTGWVASATTRILGNQTISYAFSQQRYFFRFRFKPEVIDYQRSLYPSQYPKRIARFLYKESKDGQNFEKYVDWDPENSYEISDYKDFDTNNIWLPEDFFNFLASQIPVDPDVKRIAIGVDLMLYIANEEFFTFLDLIYRNDVSQTIPAYTNIDNGLGIFSSRYYYTYFAKRLTLKILDSLSWGRYTYDHKFRDSQGNWH
ncbi:DUF4249 family protein [Bacteroidota bacterium]